MRERTKQRVVTGMATVVVLALALSLFIGRSPNGSPSREEVSLGQAVETDLGTVTVSSLDPVPPGTPGAPPAVTGTVVDAIQFRSCRTDPEGTIVDLSAFSVRTADGTSATAAGSQLTESSGDCTGGAVYVVLPASSSPTEVEYAANPVAVWKLPAA
jgi:hypothetical protein